MATSDSAWVTQRLPADVTFSGQTVAVAVTEALDDNDDDKYAALADLWERIDAEMLYEEADLRGAFRYAGPLALKKAEYWRSISTQQGAAGKIEFVDANYDDVPSGDSSEFGTPFC